MKKHIVSLLLAGAGVCSCPAQAQEAWTLRQCIDYAIEHNINIRQTANLSEQSKVNVNTTKWARLPNLNGNANQNWSWGRTTSPIDNSYTDINSGNTSFNLGTNVPIFTGMQLSNEYALAKLELKAAIEDLKKAKEDVAINIASSYLQTLLNLELSKVAQSQVALSQEQLNRIKGLFDVGKASPAEVAEAQARVAQEQMTAVQAENKYKLSLLDLSQLLELPTPEGFVLTNPEEEIAFAPLTAPDDIYSEAIVYKPGIKAAEYRLEGMEKSIRIAQSHYYPQLSFSAGLGTNYYTVSGQNADNFGKQMKNNLNKSVGFSLTVPIFNRFSTRNLVKTTRLKQTYQTLQLENTKKELYKEIQQAWYSAVAAESQFGSSASAVKANEESFRLISEKFDNGKATPVEYNEAKTNLTKALSDRIQAKYNYIFSTKILDFYKGQPIE